MKRLFFAAITGTAGNRQMGEIMEAEYGEEWGGDVVAYLENLDPAPAYLEGPEHIPGDIQQNFTNSPSNICVVFADDEPREVWWSDETR